MADFLNFFYVLLLGPKSRQLQVGRRVFKTLPNIYDQTSTNIVYQILAVNPFVPNATFLYPPGKIRKLQGFPIFLGGRERVNWEQMG